MSIRLDLIFLSLVRDGWSLCQNESCKMFLYEEEEERGCRSKCEALISSFSKCYNFLLEVREGFKQKS